MRILINATSYLISSYFARNEMGESSVAAPRSGSRREYDDRLWLIFKRGRLMIISLLTKFLKGPEGDSLMATSSIIEQRLSLKIGLKLCKKNIF